MRVTRFVGLSLIIIGALCAASPLNALNQDSPVRRGRKYKPPPPTSHIVVQVVKNFNGKPVANAAVVFNPTLNGKDIGSLEIKTDPDGKAIIDVIPTGSTVRVQIIANGFATYADDFVIDEPSREIDVKLLRPREQVSAYRDNGDAPAVRKPGVQEPAKPVPPPAKSDSALTPSSPNH